MLGDPIVFAMSVEIARRPEVVWPYLVDWERLGRWMIEARDFRVVGDRREGVGVVAEATVRIAGITTRDRIRVTRWEPPRVLEIAHLGWVKGTGYIESSPIDAGTSVSWREGLRPPWGWLGRSGMGLFVPLMRRAFRRDLRLLKELVESETSREGSG
jgi:carbon monoxide dehydrogenase subunit G